MNEADCIRELWTRARARVAQHHAHDLSGEAGERCLVCGAEAAMREKRCAEHVFCAERCQRRLHFFGRAFSALGMVKDESDEEGDDERRPARKRGVEALDEEHPEVYEVWLPDEVVCSLILWAFDFRLRTVAEYEELRAMRAVSRRFRDIINDCVRPQLRELPDEVVARMSEREVLKFRHLGRLVLSTKTPQLTGALLPALHDLEDVTIRTVTKKVYTISVDVTDEQVRALHRARRLEFEQIEEGGALSDAALDGLIWVEELTLFNTLFSDGCLAPMRNLRKLRLSENQKVRDLSALAQSLTWLELWTAWWITDETLRALTNLRVLAIDGNGDEFSERVLDEMAELRGLDVRDCGWVTDRTLRPLFLLESLLLDRAPQVSMHAVMRLAELRSLSIDGGGAPLGGGVLTNLRRLTWLSATDWVLSNRHLDALINLTFLDLSRCRGANLDHALAAMVNLTCLILRKTRVVTGDCFSALVQLDTLSLEANKRVRGETLRTLVSLRVLNLSGNTKVRDEHLVGLHLLEEIYMIRSMKHNTAVTLAGLLAFPALRLVARTGHFRLYGDLPQDAVADLRARGIVVIDDLNAWSRARLPQPLYFQSRHY